MKIISNIFSTLRTRQKDIMIIWVVSVLSSLIIPVTFKLFPPATLEIHFPHGSNEILERNFDGPIYVVIAETLYNPDQITEINFNKLPASYFANHFPLFPLMIRYTSLIGLNYFQSALILTWLSAGLFTTLFYLFLVKFNLTQHPLKLALVSLFIPARWLATRTVPGTEPIFSLLMMAMIYLWFSRKYFYASLVGVLMTLSRPPGIIFFFAFGLVIIYDLFEKKFTVKKLLEAIKTHWHLILMPLSILGLFYFYQQNFGNFFAYFETGTGTNVHIKNFPFAGVVGYITPMSEGFIYLLLIFSIGVYLLWKQGHKHLALISLVYLIPNYFMTVDDLYRYLIPIAPFALVIAFQKYIHTKASIYFFIIFLIGTYIYTIDLLPKRMFNYWDYANLRLVTSGK